MRERRDHDSAMNHRRAEDVEEEKLGIAGVSACFVSLLLAYVLILGLKMNLFVAVLMGFGAFLLTFASVSTGLFTGHWGIVPIKRFHIALVGAVVAIAPLALAVRPHGAGSYASGAEYYKRRLTELQAVSASDGFRATVDGKKAEWVIFDLADGMKKTELITVAEDGSVNVLPDGDRTPGYVGVGQEGVIGQAGPRE